MPAKYFYCIIPCAEERGFENVNPVGGGGIVHTVPCGGLAAVVSDSPATEYESTRTNMIAHQRVQERVMKEFTLLPVRFGTVASSPSPDIDISMLLEKRSEEFEDHLEEMAGKVELGVKALWRSEEAVYHQVLVENPEVRRLRDSLAGRPAAALRFEALPLGEKVKAALQRMKRREAAKLMGPLSQIACRVRENAVILDRMILNAAFLVDQGSQSRFDEELERLDNELGHRISFRYVGPVPPWNFVEIMVNWETAVRGSVKWGS